MEKVESPRRLRRKARLEEIINEVGSASELARAIGTPKSHISAMAAGRRGVGDDIAGKIERHYGKPEGWFDLTITTPNVKWSLEPENIKQNQPLALTDKAQVATNNVATLAQITKGLSAYFEAMDASTRKMAMGLIEQLADDPQDHERIAAMIELSIHSKRQKAA